MNKKIISLILVFTFLLGAIPVFADGMDLVIFEDSVLEEAVSQQLGIPIGEITEDDMENLYFLEVRNKGIESLKGLEYAVNIFSLNLMNNNITDISSLEGLTSLNTLYLANNEVSNLESLTYLTSLKILDLSSNDLTNIELLVSLTVLEELYLVNNKIIDIEALSGLTELTTLILDRNDITDIDPLKDLDKLEELSIKLNMILFDEEPNKNVHENFILNILNYDYEPQKIKPNKYDETITINLIEDVSNEVLKTEIYEIGNGETSVEISVYLQDKNMRLVSHDFPTKHRIDDDGSAKITLEFDKYTYDINYNTEGIITIPYIITDYEIVLNLIYAELEVVVDVEYVDITSSQKIDSEVMIFNDFGEKTISAKEIKGYEIPNNTKEIHIDLDMFLVGVNTVTFEMNKLPIPADEDLDNLIHVKYINVGDMKHNELSSLIESNYNFESETFDYKKHPYTIGEHLEIPITVFFENEMIEIFTYGTEMKLRTSGGEEKATGDYLKYMYDDLDENYGGFLAVDIPLLTENPIKSFSTNHFIFFKNVKPKAKLSYTFEGNILKDEYVEFNTMGEHEVTASNDLEEHGYKIKGEKTKVVLFKYPSETNHIVEVDFELEKMGEPTTPVEPSRPSRPIAPIVPIKPVEPPETPTVVDISEGNFISRWKNHLALEDSLIYQKDKEVVEYELSSENNTLLKDNKLQPRLYQYNEQKGKWVALATKIKGDSLESYEKVEGHIAIFGVKQPTFSDIKGEEWFVEKLDRANGFALIEGYVEKDKVLLKAENNITKEELYAIVGRLFGSVNVGQTSLYEVLGRLEESNNGTWSTPHFEEFQKKGIISAIPTLEERKENATRQEVLELLTKMIDKVEKVERLDLSKFNDIENSNIQLANIVNGYEDGSLKLNHEISRIEALVIIVNALEKLGW